MSIISEEIKEKLSKRSFSCQRCSRCCRKEPGIVALTQNDFENARKNLNLSAKDFLEQCCREIYRDGEVFVGLKEKQNYDCIFWHNECIIYEDRPVQCRTFPFWPYLVEDDDAWKYEKNRCPGLDQESGLNLDEKYDLYKEELSGTYMHWPTFIKDD